MGVDPGEDGREQGEKKGMGRSDGSIIIVRVLMRQAHLPLTKHFTKVSPEFCENSRFHHTPYLSPIYHIHPHPHQHHPHHHHHQQHYNHPL